MKPWGDIKLSAQRARLLGVLTFRRWVLEDLAFNDWLDADYEQYLIEQLPVERARLLRVLDARFAQLYSEGLENEAMHWFRTDLVRVLAAREEQLFWERMRQQQERIDKLKADFERALEMGHNLLRRAYRQDLVRVLRARENAVYETQLSRVAFLIDQEAAGEPVELELAELANELLPYERQRWPWLG